MNEVSGEANLKLRSVQYPIWDPEPSTGWFRLPAQSTNLRVHLAALGIPIINDKLYPTMTGSADDLVFQPSAAVGEINFVSGSAKRANTLFRK
jgi:hypothetical protein